MCGVNEDPEAVGDAFPGGDGGVEEEFVPGEDYSLGIFFLSVVREREMVLIRPDVRVESGGHVGDDIAREKRAFVGGGAAFPAVPPAVFASTLIIGGVARVVPEISFGYL